MCIIIRADPNASKFWSFNSCHGNQHSNQYSLFVFSVWFFFLFCWVFFNLFLRGSRCCLIALKKRQMTNKERTPMTLNESLAHIKTKHMQVIWAHRTVFGGTSAPRAKMQSSKHGLEVARVADVFPPVILSHSTHN